MAPAESQVSALDSKLQAAPAGADAGQSSGHGNWFVDDVVKPFVNGAAIEPLDAVSGIVDGVTQSDILPRMELLSEPKEGGVGGFAQSISGGIGSLVPYVIVGKLTGHALQGTGRLIEASPRLSFLEFGGATSKVLASSRLGMIAGAGFYGGAIQPGAGQSRLGDAAGSVAGFSAFELGGKLGEGMSLTGSIPLRAATGLVGGALQLGTSNLIADGNLGSFHNLVKQGVTGSVMNVLLPFAQEGVGRSVDALSMSAGRPVSADSFAARADWMSTPGLKPLLEETPLTRVKLVDSETRINQKSNVIELNRADGANKLVHELSHRVSAKGSDSESQFQQAASLLDPNSTDSSNDAAWQMYRGIRLSQEQAALRAENVALADVGKPAAPSNDGSASRDAVGSNNADVSSDPTSIPSRTTGDGRTYEQLWQDEFEKFKATDGKFRPTVDYSGEPTSYEDAVRTPFKLLEDRPEAKARSYLSTGVRGALHPWWYQFEDVPGKFFYTSKLAQGSDGLVTRFIKADDVDHDGSYKGGRLDLMSEPVDYYGYGTTRAVETFPSGAVHVHITEGATVPGESDGDTPVKVVPDNVVLKLFDGGAEDPKFGTIVATVNGQDGSVWYQKADGTEAAEYGTSEDNPTDRWFGKVASEDHKTDDSVVYSLSEGNPEYGLEQGDTAEWHPNGLRTSFMYDGSSTQENIDTILRGKNLTTYMRPDQTYMSLIKSGATLTLVDHGEEGEVTSVTHPESVVENHTVGLNSPIGTVHVLEFRGDSSLSHTGQGGFVQTFDTPQDMGPQFPAAASYTRLDDGREFFKTPEGSVLNFYDNPTRLTAGSGTTLDGVIAHEAMPTGWSKYYIENGTTVEDFPQGLAANVQVIPGGQVYPETISTIEHGPNGYTMHFQQAGGNPSSWGSLEHDTTAGTVTLRNQAGAIIPGGDLSDSGLNIQTA